HLGDEAIVACRALGFDCLYKATGCGLVMSLRHHLGPGPHGLCGRDFLALIGFDLLENIGHCARPFETATRRASVSFALPLSIASRAMATPALRSSALSATINAAAALSSTISRYAPGAPSKSAWIASA